MGNTYISNTIDLIDAITDCNNCNCDKQENESCSRCDFCVIPNYVKVGCTDNTIIGEHILTSKHKSVKLIRNPKSKSMKSKSRSKYTPPIMPAPIKIKSSMTYFNDNGDDNDSSSMDRVIATIEPYPLPPTPSNSPCDHYYIPGHSNSSSPHSTSMGSPLTPLSTNGTSYRYQYQNPNRKNNRSSPNSVHSASEYSTVDMNTSNDNKEDDIDSHDSGSEYHEEIYKRQIQKAIIERNTFYISHSYDNHSADDNHSSHSSSYMSDIPEEDVVEIKPRKNSNSLSRNNRKKQKRNSLVPKFDEEIGDNGNDQELILKEIKSKKSKKMRQFKPRHVPSSKDAMF